MGSRKYFFVLGFVFFALFVLSLIGQAQAESAADTEQMVLQLHFDEKDANPKDSSGKANKVLNKGAVYTEGKFGGALRFDGVNDIVEIISFPFLDSAGTIEAWVWIPDSPSEEHETILRIDSHLRLDSSLPPLARTAHIIQRGKNTGDIVYQVYRPEGVGSYLVSSDQKEGWHHIVAAYDSQQSATELFVDGISAGKGDYSEPTACNGASLVIGAYGSNRFNGIIDEVTIYNRVLTEKEIMDRYLSRPLIVKSAPSAFVFVRR